MSKDRLAELLDPWRLDGGDEEEYVGMDLTGVVEGKEDHVNCLCRDCSYTPGPGWDVFDFLDEAEETKYYNYRT